MEEASQPHEVDVIVGARVRLARTAKGMTQSALGEMLGVSFQQIQKYENGTNRISASRLVEIADTLQATPTSFLDGLGAFGRSATGARELSPSAAELLDLYERLPIAMRDAVLQLAQSLASGALSANVPVRAKPRGRAR